MNNSSKDSLKSIYSNPLNFISKRLPNIEEAIISAASQASFDTFTGRVKLWFGDNPSAPAIFRDISKLPSVYANVYSNSSLGYTDVKYDEGALWSHSLKVVCKGAVLTTSPFIPILEEVAFDQLARSTNYICEVPNRYLSIATREKQRFERANPENKKEFWKFMVEDAKSSWWGEATGEALIKTTISDQLGEGVKHVGYIKLIREGATLIDNYIALSLGGNAAFSFTPEDDIYAKAIKIFSMFGVDYRTPVVFTLTTAVDWSAKFSTEIINSHILGTPTKTCQDFTGIAIREFNELTFSGEAEITNEL